MQRDYLVCMRDDEVNSLRQLSRLCIYDEFIVAMRVFPLGIRDELDSLAIVPRSPIDVKFSKKQRAIDAEMLIFKVPRSAFVSTGQFQQLASRGPRRRRQLDVEGFQPSDELLTSDCGNIHEDPNKRERCTPSPRIVLVQCRLAVTCQIPVRNNFP